MTAPTSLPDIRCAACGEPVGNAARRDVVGRVFCDNCYQQFRLDPDAAPRGLQFRCTVCGKPAALLSMGQAADRAVCRDCLSADATMPDDVATPLGTESPAALPVDHFPTHHVDQITCPHCWHRFGPGALLWIAMHPDLLGDAVLGPEALPRFLPSRFDLAGDALDPRGTPCRQFACPRCHLIVPRSLLETPPLMLSIVGSPGSGKSHLLAALAWEARRVLHQQFGCLFTDAEPEGNRVLNEYEETLFLPIDPDEPVVLRKTELQGELYDQVTLGEQVVTLPRPFLFTIRPAGGRPRVLCVYDNAGEHFQPGMDTFTSPGTQHLAGSRAILFLYDPTQDLRLRGKLRDANDPQLTIAARTPRQETLLAETAARVRKLRGVSTTQRDPRPLLVLISKADVFAHALDFGLDVEPFAKTAQGFAVDLPRVWRTSQQLRALLLETNPGLIAAADDFSAHVVYIPISALGHAPSIDERTGTLSIRPRDITPHWVTVPLLYLLARAKQPLVPGVGG